MTFGKIAKFLFLGTLFFGVNFPIPFEKFHNIKTSLKKAKKDLTTYPRWCNHDSNNNIAFKEKRRRNYSFEIIIYSFCVTSATIYSFYSINIALALTAFNILSFDSYKDIQMQYIYESSSMDGNEIEEKWISIPEPMTVKSICKAAAGFAATYALSKYISNQYNSKG